MWVQSLFVLVSVISIIGSIKVPIDTDGVNNPEIVPSASASSEKFQVRPIYYVSSGESSKSHLIPPDPYQTREVPNDIPTPATYLLPPSPDAQNEYFSNPTEPGEQTDWYPVSELTQVQNIDNDHHENENKENLRTGKTLHRGQVLSMPTRNLLPLRENAPNDFIVVPPSVELQLPLEEIDHTIVNQSPDLHILRTPPPRSSYEENIPAHHISPNKYYGKKYKNPTGLYPKKYVGEFKPIPIPISQYEDGLTDEIPVARPLKVINPSDIQEEYASPAIQHDDSTFDKTRKLNKYNEATKLTPESDDTYREVSPSEQDTSETNFRHNTRDAHPAPVRQVPQTPNPYKSDGKRTEFRMHGMKGPHSYQFGYDTGKGKNRQFRYEERDNDGHVRGHYGYVDRGGKLRVVNYDAHPQHGFRASAADPDGQ